MGNVELQKNLWAHICLVDIELYNVLWFDAWAKCLNQLFLCDFKAVDVLWQSLGLLSTEEYVDAATYLPHGDKSKRAPNRVICWLLQGQLGSLQKSNDI